MRSTYSDVWLSVITVDFNISCWIQVNEEPSCGESLNNNTNGINDASRLDATCADEQGIFSNILVSTFFSRYLLIIFLY